MFAPPPIRRSYSDPNHRRQEKEDASSAQSQPSHRWRFKDQGDSAKESSHRGLGFGGVRSSLTRDPYVCIAIYIAMAHGGLALSIAVLFGLAKLLQGYWRPIQWALLCSMPLRELHTAIVSFWSHPLHLGLLETLLAIPLAILGSAAGSLIDSHAAVLRLFRRGARRSKKSRTGFSKLMQWLVSFGVFVLLRERIGLLSVPVFLVSGFIAYAAGSRPPNVATTLSMISARRIRRKKSSAGARLPFRSRLSRYLTSGILIRLNTLVAVNLIIMMIVGSVSGFLFFTYKIGIEGKDAVISLKTHLEDNYSERIGLQQWMDDNDVPEMIESWTSKFYDSVSQYVDSLALQYNATEIVDGFKHYLMKPLDQHPSNASASTVYKRVPHFSLKMRHLMIRIRNQEWKLIYDESYGFFMEFFSEIASDDLVEKVKGLALQSIDVSKRVLASSTTVLAGSANLMLTITLSIISGAAGLLSFVSQITVFFWLLYYLITSESGGVMDNVIEMLPISKATRVRCAQVLGHAVSSVLLGTAKVALFQGFLTYLLFRFYHIQFLYVSTFIASMTAIFPITPFWVSSIPAAAQLSCEARYVEAVLLTALHLFLLDYGTSCIQDQIPGKSDYLTGLSILGGVALFPSILEGAIMGPLLMTVMIALKNLYAEFVL